MKCNYKLYAWLYIIAPIIFALIAPIYYPTFWLMTSLNKLVAGVDKIKWKFIKKRDHDTYNSPNHSASCSG